MVGNQFLQQHIFYISNDVSSQSEILNSAIPELTDKILSMVPVHLFPEDTPTLEQLTSK